MRPFLTDDTIHYAARDLLLTSIVEKRLTLSRCRFGRGPVDSGNRVLRGFQIPTGRGFFIGGMRWRSVTYRREKECSIGHTKMTEPIDMPFGLVTEWGGPKE